LNKKIPKLNRIVNRIVSELDILELSEKEIIKVHVEPKKPKISSFNPFTVSVWRRLIRKNGETYDLLFPIDIITLKRIAGQNHSFWYVDKDGFTINVLSD